MAGNNKESYTIVGRYMNGREVSGYHIVGGLEQSGRRITRELLIHLVSRGKIDNCTIQVYNNDIILRGKGISLNDLPIFDEKAGELRNTGNLGEVKTKTSTDKLEQVMITARIMINNKCVGYEVTNVGGVTKRISRRDVLTLAGDKRIGNARTQQYNGKTLIRGVGVELNQLPTIVLDENGAEVI